jgi:hypothetical protein
LLAADFETVMAKLRRANQHAEWLKRTINDFFGTASTYDLMFDFENYPKEIDVYGHFVRKPPLAYFGAVFGDIMNCYRSALDHIVWALSVRHQIKPPPPHPLPPGSPWKDVGFPICLDPGNNWKSALGSKLRLVDPNLHADFRSVQPFVTGPKAPEEEWLAMLEGLWNVDKHRVVHIANVDISLEMLNVTLKSNGRALQFSFVPGGPQRLDLGAFDKETHLGRVWPQDPWPEGVDEGQVERGIRVNVLLDDGSPGFGKNMEFIQNQINHAVIYTACIFEPLFT